MASRVFTEASVIGITLAEVREGILIAAEKLNNERVGVQGFATVYVSQLLQEPRPLVGMSFIVQYSDHDDDAPRLIDSVLRQIIRVAQEEQKFYQTRDPYCA